MTSPAAKRCGSGEGLIMAEESGQRAYENARAERRERWRNGGAGGGPGKGDDAPWPQTDDAAYYGLVGEIVRAIEPQTEADPVAILLQVLAFAGNIIGGAPYYQVEADQHHVNLFAVLIGVSAKGRKGTSAGRAKSV